MQTFKLSAAITTAQTVAGAQIRRSRRSMSRSERSRAVCRAMPLGSGSFRYQILGYKKGIFSDSRPRDNYTTVFR